MIPGTYSMILSLIFGALYPALFIWCVNTLFRVGIPFTFKTYFASLLMFMCLRYFLTKEPYRNSPLDDYYGYDDDDDDYDDDEEYEDDDEPDNPPSGSNLRRIK